MTGVGPDGTEAWEARCTLPGDVVVLPDPADDRVQLTVAVLEFHADESSDRVLLVHEAGRSWLASRATVRGHRS